MRRFSHIMGFDDAPFSHAHRGDVGVVGAVFCQSRLEGIVTGRVRRDGANATQQLAALVSESPFYEHLQLIMLQGVALAGFNVVNVFRLHQLVSLPVLVVSRRQPNLEAIRVALLNRVPGGPRKWRLIEQLGPMEPLADVYVQRMGLSLGEAETVIRQTAIHGKIPEPLRAAHLIAGGLARGFSRGGA